MLVQELEPKLVGEKGRAPVCYYYFSLGGAVLVIRMLQAAVDNGA